MAVKRNEQAGIRDAPAVGRTDRRVAGGRRRAVADQLWPRVSPRALSSACRGRRSRTEAPQFRQT
jgi:hypothetical protein